MLLALFLLLTFSFASPPPEYVLLKKFRESKDVGTALFLLSNFPDAVFVDELRIELAEILLRQGERDRAKEILEKVNLNNVRDEYGQKVLRLWKHLALNPKPLILRFPELATDLIREVVLSPQDKEKILKRLLSKGRFEDVLKLSGEFCFYRGLALFRMRRHEESLKVLLNCEDKRGEFYILSAYLKLGKVKEAESFARQRDNSVLYYYLGRYFFVRSEYRKARKQFLYASDFTGHFYTALISYIEGKYLSAFSELSEAELKASGSLDLSRVWFWKFKTLLKLGYRDLAYYYLKKTAEIEGFYGAIARKMLGRRVFEPIVLQDLRENGKGISDRLKGIKELGFLYYMRLEAFRKAEDVTPKDIVEIAKIDPYTAIRLAVRVYGVNSNIYRMIAFPTPYRDVVLRVSRRFKIDPALIYAIMRQESLFDPIAVSRSNAKGLMQLLDSTARWKAERIKLEFEDVFDIETNVTLGVAYLRYLLDLWKGDLIRAIASYNAGQGAAGRWKRYKDDFVFIESIPYRETRNYVKRVLWFYYVYSEKFSK